ncbi:hypothetical protein DRW07_13895 [Alteromonas sediminis]|uniref:Cyanophycinase n=1 Tax=Alteromonas sediminis TaxID=2259342 RepID=A0A3N5XXU5_9ALTE|nr:cyanophycinase [Alteromonas sediminis]RPJ65897.1 hypothetical protein DRW07_13895 [Alteromonas sediminis]
MLDQILDHLARRIHRSKDAILTVFFIPFFLISYSVLAENEQYELVLAGGALKTCSSMTKKQCENDVNIVGGKQQLLFQFSPEARALWINTPQFSQLPEEIKQAFYAIDTNEYSKLAESTISRGEFLDALDAVIESKSGLKDFTRLLSDPAYYALVDFHEVQQIDSKGARLQEKVSVPDNTNAASVDVYNAFVDQARLRLSASNKDKAPNIVVITASSRDHFESADFYEGVFESLNVNVQWLPLSAAWQEAQYLREFDSDICSRMVDLHSKRSLFNRKAVYPDRVAFEKTLCENPSKVIDALTHAQGVFFNGGDQSKTLAALLTPQGLPSEALMVIRKNMQNGQLVVGGTSAGTAVQAGGAVNNNPIPMLTNGIPSAAIKRGVFAYSAPSVRCSETSGCSETVRSDDVTYRAEGGTGLFRQGLLDTHFSERNREVRLIMTALAAQQNFGFGVDETTALMVRQEGESTHFKVIGERGVFVADLRTHDYRQVNTHSGNTRSVGGLAHFWPTGTKVILNRKGFAVSWPANDAKAYAYTDESQWRAAVRANCQADKPFSWQHDNVTYLLQANTATQFSQSPMQCGYANLPFAISHK